MHFRKFVQNFNLFKRISKNVHGQSGSKTYFVDPDREPSPSETESETTHQRVQDRTEYNRTERRGGREQ